MTSVLDLNIAIGTIIDVFGNNNIFGFEFNQLLNAIRTFRAYYYERKDSYGIPIGLFNELDGYISQFPTVSYHYTFKSSDQNRVVEALRVIGQMVLYSPPPVSIGYFKRVYVHWLWPNGTVRQTFDYMGNQKPMVPHWIDGTDYADGNVKLEMVWHAQVNKSIRFDTRTTLLWSNIAEAWVLGECQDTPLVQDYSFYRYLRMPPENISQWCKLEECSENLEYVSLPVPIQVTDVAPPPPLTASVSGKIKAYNPSIYPPLEYTGPIAGAKVSVAGLSDLTDAQGDYVISSIPVGFHTWIVEKAGYRTTRVGEEYTSGEIKHRDAVITPT